MSTGLRYIAPLEADDKKLGVAYMQATVLPEDIIKAIADLNGRMRDDHRDHFAEEVTVIWDMCEQAFAAEFDRGYELAQETAGEWYEPEPSER